MSHSKAAPSSAAADQNAYFDIARDPPFITALVKNVGITRDKILPLLMSASFLAFMASDKFSAFKAELGVGGIDLKDKSTSDIKDEQDRLIFGMTDSNWMLFGSHERSDIALEIAYWDGLDWSDLAREWPRFDNIYHNGWKRLFARDRHLWRPDIFSAEQRAFYDSLPDKITVYRGCHRGTRNGHRRLSWTTNERVAHWFSRAGMRLGTPVQGRVVYKASIKKKNVALALPDRDESEIVPFSARAIYNIEALDWDEGLADARAAALAQSTEAAQ